LTSLTIPLTLNHIKTPNKMKTTSQTTIEKKLGKSVQFSKASDCVNLLYTAKIDGVEVANVYKSFDKNFNQIEIIRYCNRD